MGNPIVPAEGAATGTLWEHSLFSQQAPETYVALRVPDLQQGLFQRVAHGGLQRAGIDVSIGIHPRSVPRVQTLIVLSV